MIIRVTKFFAILLLFFSTQLPGQVSFNVAPSRLQLYPRGSDDSATVVLNGFVSSAQNSKLIFSYLKDNVILNFYIRFNQLG